MNEQLEQRIKTATKNIESRSQSEKLLILAVIVACLVLSYLSLAFDPARASITTAQNQLNSLERQIQAQQTSYSSMVAASQQDPNKFANDRLAVIAREQNELDIEISSLAGDLISPADMTRILTSVLDRQAGLELISFQNKAAVPLRADISEEGLLVAGDSNGQVFEHGLEIVFQGDFFSTLKYLRFLEEISGTFFWDAVNFKQVAWPDAMVTLEIHTLSSNAGFIGV